MNKEVWETVNGYERYLISNFGKVKNAKSGRILKPHVSKDGYATVILCKNGKPKSFRIHRLVATAFLPNPESKLEVNHKDYNRSNNCVANLEWIARKENFNYSLCNKRKRDAIVCPTNTGEHHISHHLQNDVYSVSFRRNGKRRSKYFHSLEEAVWFRDTIYKLEVIDGKNKIILLHNQV